MAQLNETVQKQVRQYFRQLTIMFTGFIASILLFLITVLIVVESADAKSHDLDTVMLIVAPLSSFALVLVANRLFVGRLRPAKTATKLHEKMDAYRGAVVLRFMLLDGAAFIQLIAFFMTENRLFLPIAVVVTTLLMLYRPTVGRFVKDLELHPVEEKVIRDHAAH